MMLQEVGAGFPVIGGQEVGVNIQSAVFIARAARQLRVDLVLGDENGVVLPRKALPGLVGRPRLGKRLKGRGHAIGIVMMPTHDTTVIVVSRGKVA